MAITEEHHRESDEDSSEEEASSVGGVPAEFLDLHRDKQLTQVLIDLIQTAADLDILDFEGFGLDPTSPTATWYKTKTTTGSPKPVY
jgi:hypothetical protein